MTDTDPLDARWVMVCSRRRDAINAHNRDLLQIEIAKRNAIAAGARVAECDKELTELLDAKLEARYAAMDKLADAMVDAGS